MNQMTIVIKKAGFEALLNSGDYYLKALIIGDNGAGKTPFAAQWPKPLFALTENGHMSLAISGTPYADVKSSADMAALLHKVTLESRKPAASREYQTFVVDTIDSYQKILISERLKQTQQEGLSGWADWGWLEAKMASLIETLKALPMNVVVLMHTKDVEEEVDGATRVSQRARMKGDIKESVYDNFPLIGLVESYYAAEAEGGKAKRVLKRRLRWAPDPKHSILRDQSTRLPTHTAVDFKPSDYEQIFTAISGGLDSLPQAEALEELETPEDAQAGTPESVDQVGALERPALPKAAAKKTAAKKTAAKKTAAAKKAESPSPQVEATPEPEPETPETPAEGSAPAPEPETATSVEDPPAEAEDPWTPPVEEPPADVHAPAHEVAKQAAAKAAEAQKARAEEPKQEAPKPAGRVCGGQPKTFEGKYEPHAGCGAAIPTTSVSASTAVVKFKTFLCDDCFAAAIG